MSEIKVISLDLWGTLFDDSKYIEDLNTRRASILETISETMDSSTWHDVLSNECKVYKEYEIAGFYIPLASRVTRLLKKNCKNEFSEIDVNQVISCFERIALEYTPAVNWEILELVSLYAVRNKCVLILSSNTGLISSNATEVLMRRVSIYRLFHRLYFSESLMVSKCNPLFFGRIFEDYGIPASSFLHIGDNLESDYLSAKKIGGNAILI